jgi:hypothetical protein
MQYDFRQIYASVLKDWFELSDADVKSAMGNKSFNTLPIFKNNSASVEDYVDLVSRISLNKIYPNPATENTDIEYFTESGNVKMTVFDAMGQQVAILKEGWHAHGTYTVNFAVSGLRKGNYYVQMSQGEKRQTEVLLVQ